jgi:hypothetical protein
MRRRQLDYPEGVADGDVGVQPPAEQGSSPARREITRID